MHDSAIDMHGLLVVVEQTRLKIPRGGKLKRLDWNLKLGWMTKFETAIVLHLKEGRGIPLPNRPHYINKELLRTSLTFHLCTIDPPWPYISIGTGISIVIADWTCSVRAIGDSGNQLFSFPDPWAYLRVAQ